jgi:hypothetical protein
MKNSIITYRISLFLIAILYLLYRVTNVYLVTPLFDEFDSPAYYKLEFFPSFRTHGITILFSLVKNEFLISLIQAIIGSLVWIYLWISVLRIINSTITKILFTFLFYLLGCSSVIVEHDSSILSESLAFSSTVFLITSALNLYLDRENQRLSFVYFGLAIVWFASTKSSNSLLTPLLLLIFLLTMFRFYKNRFNIIFGSTILIFGTFLFLNVLSSDITKTLTTSGTINNRLVFVDNWKSQLIKSGYPVKAFKTFENYSQANLGIPPDQAVVNLPEFKQWWNSGGDSFLLDFTARNLDYAVIAPVALPIFSEDLNFRKSILSGWSQGTDLTDDYTGFRNSILERTLFWPDEPEKAYLALAVGLFVLGVSLLLLNWLGKTKEFNLFIQIIILTIIWSYLNWWFGSKPADMARHNLSAAILFKLIPLMALFLSIDKFISRKKL